MDQEKVAFLTSIEQNVSDFDSSNEEIVSDLIKERYGKGIEKPTRKLKFRWNNLRRYQDIVRVIGDMSSSDEGSTFSGTSLEKQFSNESNSSNSETNDEPAIEQRKLVRSYQKIQNKMFERDRINNYYVRSVRKYFLNF